MTTITLPRATVEQALEALENGKRVRACEGGTKFQIPLEDSAITALRAALNKPQRPDGMKDVYASLRGKAMRNRP